MSCMAFSYRSLALGLLYASFMAVSGGRVDVNDMLMMDRFRQWQAEHGRSYPSAEEELRRFKIYRRNVAYINAANRRPGRTYELDENGFADLSKEEFLAMYTKPLPPAGEEGRGDGDGPIITTRAGRVDGGGGVGNVNISYGHLPVQIPTSVDWRAKGAVVPPKSQNPCGCCWAFATVATIESLYKIKTGQLVPLSEQELVDCDTTNNGCHGGFPSRAYRWVVLNGGITTESDYPYVARKSWCNTAKARHHDVKISGHVHVPANREHELARAVAQQPVAVAIEAIDENFMFYRRGVYRGPCGTALNHAVTVAGYGVDGSSGLKYWIVKNSWGQGWGEGGYVRMEKDVGAPEGLCGIAIDVAYPTM